MQSSTDIIAQQLTAIFNKLINLHSFPDPWKLSIIIPIYKKESHLYPENYRPISLLPNVSKVFEKILFVQIMDHINKHSILPNCQYGFRSRHSTSTCCSDLMNYIYSSTDKGLYVAAIFLDFSKAFDLIPHDLLLQKLKILNFSSNTIALLACYLSNRSQMVFCNGSYSSELAVEYGVPQGSILGPLLYLLYVNDFDTFVDLCKIIMFADDTNLIFAHKDFNVLVSIINADLCKIALYCQNNQLMINSSKSKAMIFYNGKQNLSADFMLNGSRIDIVDTHKFLGVYLDCNMTFNHHIEHVCKKLSSANFAIVKCRVFLNRKLLLMLFNALSLSHIYYCDTNYLFHCSKLCFKRIESKYVDGGRIILSNKRGSSRTETLLTLNWLSLDKCLFTHIACLVYNIIDNGPHNLNILFNPIVHGYTTRNVSALNYSIPNVKTNRGKKAICYWGPKIWNSIPLTIRSSPTIDIFKVRLHKFITGPDNNYMLPFY